ncbi:MAG: biotin--[acetyl-CoA-carboxylase] ligase, partial [Bdellovibrionales bacterium]|nr:biotin--[acetyl-CoA-carboxylase] ligase [Bdellovibrionales bacterium]
MIDVKVLHRLTDVSWHVLQLESCSSTMDYLQSLAPQLGVTEPGLIVAERQTSGRGRQGRIWNETVSALYMTLVFCLPDKPLDLSGYSLVAGCALQAVLERRGALTLLKWPNDILDAQGKKLGGILIE